MRSWAFLLGGLVVWAVHFFALYGIASIFPGTDIARALVLAATVPALVADAVLLRLAVAKRSKAADADLTSWMTEVASIGAIVSFVAVLWQALPALLL